MPRKMLAVAAVMAGLALPSARAGEYDIVATTPGQVLTANVNGAFYQVNYDHPTGTGVYNPFASGQGSNHEFELFFNTEDTNQNGASAPIFDTLGGTHTHSLLFGDLQVVTVDPSNPVPGVTPGMYYVFSLDANQQSQGGNFSDSGKLSLLQLEIFLGTTDTPVPITATPMSGPEYITGFVGATKYYDLDLNGMTAESNYVNINTAVNNGSGSGDLTVFIPTSLFPNQTANAGKFLYLYSSFGQPDPSGSPSGGSLTPNGVLGTFPNNDGFEEWKAVTGPNAPNPIPEPSTVALALSGLGTLGLAGLRRSRRRTEEASA